MGSIDGPMFLDPVVILLSEILILPVSVGLVEKDNSRVKVGHVLKAVGEFGAGRVVSCVESIGIFLNDSEGGGWDWHGLVSPALGPGIMDWWGWGFYFWHDIGVRARRWCGEIYCGEAVSSP